MKTMSMLLALFAGAVLCAAQPAAPSAKTAVPATKPAAVQSAAPAAKPAAPAAPAAKPAAVRPAAPAAKTAAPAVAEEEPGIAFCLSRGLCNICTGWLELPRCVVYDNSAIPVFGLIVGIPEGAGFTVARTLCGVFDLLSFGTTGSTCHGKVFPNTVFQSKWKSK